MPGGSPEVVGFGAVFWLDVDEAVVELVEGSEARLLCSEADQGP